MRIKLSILLLSICITSCSPDRDIAQVTGRWLAQMPDARLLMIEITPDSLLRIYSTNDGINNQIKIVKVTSSTIKVRNPGRVEYEPPKPAEGFRTIKEEFGRYKTFEYRLDQDTFTLIDNVKKVTLKGAAVR